MKPFKPPLIQFNGHLQTIIPSFFRKIPLEYKRERVELPDGDFLDIDWLTGEEKGKKPLIIISHGLEGDSQRHYVKGLAKLFNDNGYDVCAWNCRSCSGEINRLPRFYHHGDASDLVFVTNYAVHLGYKQIALAGHSMGGSLSLRSVAEFPDNVPNEVFACAAVSVPLDITNSANELNKNGKKFYMKRFLRKLYKKLSAKNDVLPENQKLNISNYKKKIKNFHDFDTAYTAPLHGYKSADDFYTQASVRPLLKNIKIPTLIIQALNDPFLGNECLFVPESELNELINLKVLPVGGHVGFVQRGKKFTYSEELIYNFFESNRLRIPKEI